MRQDFLKTFEFDFYRKLVLCDCHIKRLDHWTFWTSIITAGTTAIIPFLNGGAAITIPIALAAMTGGVTAANLKGDRYNKVVAFDQKLKDAQPTLNKIDAIFARGTNWEVDSYKKYRELLSEYEVLKTELDKLAIEAKPNCSYSRQTKLLYNNYPEALDPSLKTIWETKAKKANLIIIDQPSNN